MRIFPFFITSLAILVGSACGSAEGQSNRNADSALTSTSAGPDGKAVFRQYCVTCHGADGKLGLNGAKDLTVSILTLEERINVITYGRKVMTPFNEVLTPEEIRAVAEYTQTLSTQK